MADSGCAPTSGLRESDPAQRGCSGTREEEVGTLVAQGLSNKDIAARLFLSVRTVETHVHHLLNKLGVNSRTQIAVWFSEPRRDQLSRDRGAVSRTPAHGHPHPESGRTAKHGPGRGTSAWCDLEFLAASARHDHECHHAGVAGNRRFARWPGGAWDGACSRLRCGAGAR